MRKPAGQQARQQYEGVLEVSGLSHDGRGVARANGKTVFIDGALPGEQVRYRVIRSKARFDEARLVEILRASPERSVPCCPHYGRCGGCTLQHLAPPAQLTARQRQLADALERIARLRPHEWLAPVASEPYGYRSRARLAVAWDSQACRVTLGFRRAASRAVEPITDCPVLVPALAVLITPLAGLLTTFAAPARLHELWLTAGEPGIALGVVSAGELDSTDRGKLAVFCADRGVVLHFGTFPTEGAPIAWTEGGASLHYDCNGAGLALEFQPWHFTQVNRSVNRALIGAVLDQLQPRPQDRVLDLYCGLGNFSLPLAERAAHVTGIEGDAALVEQAQRNAHARGLGNTEFLRADLALTPAHAAWSRARYDLVLLDPPRSGAAALLPVLPKFAARRIAYVSCDAATLARDAAVLCARGVYTLTHAGVFDMFPQTPHFESLAVFTAQG